MKAEAIQRLTGERIFTTLADGRRQGRQRRRGRRRRRLRLRHRLRRRRRDPADVHHRAARTQIDPMDRATTTGTIRRLGEQTGGRVGPADFIALPCSHPDCSSLTYFVRGDDGGHRSIVAAHRSRSAQGADWRCSATGLAPDDALWESLTGLLSETAMVSRREVIDYLLDICEVCDLGVSGFIKSLGRWLTDRGSAPIDDDRAARQAPLGQDVHGSLDAERRAAPAVLRARRLDRRRGESRADPVLRPTGLRAAAPTTSAGMVPAARAHPARRCPSAHRRAGDDQPAWRVAHGDARPGRRTSARR